MLKEQCEINTNEYELSNPSTVESLDEDMSIIKVDHAINELLKPLNAYYKGLSKKFSPYAHNNKPIKSFGGRKCKSVKRKRIYREKYLAHFDTIKNLLRIHKEHHNYGYENKYCTNNQLKRNSSGNINDYYFPDQGSNEIYKTVNKDVGEFMKNSSWINHIVDKSKNIFKNNSYGTDSSMHMRTPNARSKSMKSRRLISGEEANICSYKKAKTTTIDDNESSGKVQFNEFPRIKLEKFSFGSDYKFKPSQIKKNQLPEEREVGKLSPVVLFKYI